MANVKDVYLTGFATSSALSGNFRIAKVLQVAETLGSRARVLDVGCGDGVVTQSLGTAVNARSIHGTDIAPKAVELALSNGVLAKCGDVDESPLPYPDKSFDLVYCGHLIEVVMNPDNLIRELKRVLSDNGVLLITHPNMGAWASRIAILCGRLPFYGRVSTEFDLGKMMLPTRPGKSTGFIRLFTTDAFRKFLAAHGMKQVGVWGSRESAIPGPLQVFDYFFSRIPSLSFSNIWLVRKS